MNFTVLGMWHEMGVIARVVVIVLLAMSVASLAVSADRLLAFRRAKRLSIGYIRALADILGKSGRLESARPLSEQYRGGSVARVVGAGVSEFASGIDGQVAGTVSYDLVDAVVRAMERSKDREVATLRRGLPLLATVSSSAPFVGLFGTVGGIITAFQKLADPAKGSGGIGTVSAGIAEALVTTAVGLGVAIIAVWFYNFFTARVEDIVVDLDETASELVDGVLKDARMAARAGA